MYQQQLLCNVLSLYINLHWIDCNLLLTDSTAPVKAPLVIEFQGSSFFLIYTKEQSMAENKPPHTAKFPEIQELYHSLKIIHTLLCHFNCTYM
jgi:hypothetical protein